MTYRYRQPELHQEEDDVPRWRFVIALVAVVAISLVTIVWAVAMTGARAADLRPSGYFGERWIGPRRPVARVRADLFDEQRPDLTIEARQRAALGTYGWVDPARGVVRIPIDRAMELFVQGRRP